MTATLPVEPITHLRQGPHHLAAGRGRQEGHSSISTISSETGGGTGSDFLLALKDHPEWMRQAIAEGAGEMLPSCASREEGERLLEAAKGWV